MEWTCCATEEEQMSDCFQHPLLQQFRIRFEREGRIPQILHPMITVSARQVRIITKDQQMLRGRILRILGEFSLSSVGNRTQDLPVPRLMALKKWSHFCYDAFNYEITSHEIKNNGILFTGGLCRIFHSSSIKSCKRCYFAKLN